jgi:hypothetical protein
MLVKRGVYNSGFDRKVQNAFVRVPGSNFLQSIYPISHYLIKGDPSPNGRGNLECYEKVLFIHTRKGRFVLEERVGNWNK